MKRLIIPIAVCLLALVSCKKNEADAIYVNFTNQTGQDITNLTIDNTTIGTLKTNASTGFLKFDSFTTNSGLPFCNFKGERSNQPMEGLSQFPGCGTEINSLKKGRYNVEIKISQFNSTDYFDLSFK